MKKYLYILVFVFLASVSYSARMLRICYTPSGGNCTIDNDSAIFSQPTSDAFYAVTTDPGGVAEEFLPSGTVTITGYKIWVKDDNQTGSLTVRLETDAAGQPSGSAVSGTSVALPHGDLNDGNITETWAELSSPTEVATGTYWLTVTNQSSGLDFTISRDSSDLITEDYMYDSGSGWAAGGRELRVEVWGCGTY